MAKIDTYSAISIAEIIVWSPYLLIAMYLSFRHGFGRSAGWYFFNILGLARLIGSSMQLATISSPDNTNLWVGWLILTSLGLGPLIMALLGLLGRVAGSIDRVRGGNIIPQPYQKGTNIILLVSLILVIVGGTESTFVLSGSTPRIDYDTEMKAGIALMLVGFVLTVLEGGYLAMNRASVEAGENRVLLTVFLAVPFVFVRLLYSCIRVFGNSANSVWAYLAMEVIMEIIAAGLCLGMGLTLKVIPPNGEAMSARAKLEGMVEGIVNRS